MLEVRKAEDRGQTKLDWLDSRHTFSFADYHDPAQMGFSVLRVINDDRVVPGGGFPTHSHQDMEIISYVLDGALEHKDSMGNTSIIRRGDVQRMSAGRGVTHSEFNAAADQAVHFLQIWFLPNAYGTAPGYEQKPVNYRKGVDGLRLVVAPDGRDDSVRIQQDACMYLAMMAPEQRIDYAVPAGRKTYVHLARGAVQVNDVRLKDGDGIKLDGTDALTLVAEANAELLLFDLP